MPAAPLGGGFYGTEGRGVNQAEQGEPRHQLGDPEANDELADGP